MSTVVIGAGPAGLACATQLVDHGMRVTVLEAAPQVGGLARSLRLFGQTVDCGPHRFFSRDRIVVDHWRRFAEPVEMVRRLTRIHYRGRFFRYPLEPLDAFANLDLVDTARAVASYAWQRARPIREPKNLEEWVTSRFGGHLYRTFFRTYSEKLWGVPCTRIDADWAAQRIKGLSLLEAARHALLPGRRRPKTLIDEFAYPRGGAGVVYERMAAHVRARGGEVRLGSPVREVLLDGEGGAAGVALADGTRVAARHVVSTMPLTLMVRALRGVPAAVLDACDRLRFRNTILVYLDVDDAAVFPDNWIYVHAPEVRHGRVTNFRNWSPALHGDARSSVLCVELWCFDDDALWNDDDDTLAALAERELRGIGLLGAGVRVLGSHVLRLRRSYPVYETGYAAQLARIQAHVDSIPRLLAAGRYGAFKYNNQDHSILMGLLAATEILTGTTQKLWQVNSDGDYQESGEVQALFH